MLLKKRKIQTKDRIWISDKELLETKFQPGTAFTYRIENGQMTILPSKEGLAVAKRKRGKGIVPLIDIRKADALSAFAGADALEMEIHEDRIIVSSIKKILSFGKEKEKILKTQGILLSDLKMAVGQEPSINFRNGYAATMEDAIASFGSYAKLPPRAKREIPIVLDALSLFAGAGMLDYSFKDKFNIVWANEFDEDAANSYRVNIGDHMVCADINEVDMTTLPKVDVVFGGSPCQGFSNANRKEHTRFLENSKNILVRSFIKVVQHVKPLIYVLENVPQLLTAGGGQFIQEIKDALPGYTVTTQKLNAADFGSPQSRERAFVIGSRIGPISVKAPTLKIVKTVRDAFMGLTEETPNQMDFSKPNKATLERMKYIPEGGNWQSVPEHLKTRGVHSNYLRRLDSNKPSITIANVRKSVIMPPVGDRSLSVRECARLFGLPDHFTFTGNLAAKQQQVCNGVPFELGRAVADAVWEVLMAYKRSRVAVVAFR